VPTSHVTTIVMKRLEHRDAMRSSSPRTSNASFASLPNHLLIATLLHIPVVDLHRNVRRTNRRAFLAAMHLLRNEFVHAYLAKVKPYVGVKNSWEYRVVALSTATLDFPFLFIFPRTRSLGTNKQKTPMTNHTFN
jgi:hypothetical protein